MNFFHDKKYLIHKYEIKKPYLIRLVKVYNKVPHSVYALVRMSLQELLKSTGKIQVNGYAEYCFRQTDGKEDVECAHRELITEIDVDNIEEIIDMVDIFEKERKRLKE